MVTLWSFHWFLLLLHLEPMKSFSIVINFFLLHSRFIVIPFTVPLNFREERIHAEFLKRTFDGENIFSFFYLIFNFFLILIKILKKKFVFKRFLQFFIFFFKNYFRNEFNEKDQIKIII